MVIPENVRNIGKSSFENCKNLKKVILGSGIRQISSNAFAGCTSLESLQFMGDAPSTGNRWISGVSQDLTVYHADGKKNFTGGSWKNLNVKSLSVFAPLTEIYAIPGKSHVELFWNIPDNMEKETILGFVVCYKESEETT